MTKKTETRRWIRLSKEQIKEISPLFDGVFINPAAIEEATLECPGTPWTSPIIHAKQANTYNQKTISFEEANALLR